LLWPKAEHALGLDITEEQIAELEAILRILTLRLLRREKKRFA
jgi:hypothetical protein